jgi:hypothetical protein
LVLWVLCQAAARVLRCGRIRRLEQALAKKSAGTECFPPDPGASVMAVQGQPVVQDLVFLLFCKQLDSGRPQIVHQVPSSGIGFFIVPGRLRDLGTHELAVVADRLHRRPVRS